MGAVHRAGALTFPKARSTESKYRSTPKRMKKMPKPAVPTPISATGEKVVVRWALGWGWGPWKFPPSPLDRCPLAVGEEVARFHFHPGILASVLLGNDGTGREGWARIYV